MRRLILGGLACLLFASILPAQKLENVSQELLEYVRDAKKAALTDSQVYQNATKAGWAAEDLAAALASINQAPLVHGAPTTLPNPALAEKAAAPPKEQPSPPAPANQSPAVPAAEPSKPASDEGYQIGEGDVLQVSVSGEPAASTPAALVLTDGKISVPLLKEVTAAGLTPSQLEKILEHRLAEFITGAKVTVIVSQMNSKKIYLVGAAKREGVIPYAQKMTVMQFLSEVGGLAESAKRKKIYILRYENGKEYRFPFNYDAALKGEHLEQNIPLMPGDTIVVPH